MNYIWALCKDKIGNLWIGTIGGGLHKLTTNQKGQVFIYRYDQQLPEQDVESILVDGNNELGLEVLVCTIFSLALINILAMI
jgi:ligand-binding sensor domain-containing protein